MPDERIRHAVYQTFAEGGIPLSAAISHKLQLPLEEVQHGLERLHARHALVLDPQTREPWMALPFSSVPTPFKVDGGGRSWFANCAWDAFGVPLLIGVDAVITTSCEDCGRPIVYRVTDGQLADAHGVVHFAVPAAQWWEDIGFT